MPYIDDDRRDMVEMLGAANPGELNYLLTRAVVDYVEYRGLDYQTINDVIGALEGAKLEFYRRVATPYEIVKRDKNGDVYDGAI